MKIFKKLRKAFSRKLSTQELVNLEIFQERQNVQAQSHDDNERGTVSENIPKAKQYSIVDIIKMPWSELNEKVFTAVDP